MSTIEEVRVAEKKVQEIVEGLRQAITEDQDRLQLELQAATDEYAKAIRELPM
jgi:hypothetical protein